MNTGEPYLRRTLWVLVNFALLGLGCKSVDTINPIPFDKVNVAVPPPENRFSEIRTDDPNLLGWWRFDETNHPGFNSGNQHDSWNLVAHEVIISSPGAPFSESPKASLLFNAGKRTRLTMRLNNAFPTTDIFSISAWVMCQEWLESDSEMKILTLSGPEEQNRNTRVQFGITADSISFSLRGIESTAPIHVAAKGLDFSSGKWHHVSAVSNGDMLRVYSDGHFLEAKDLYTSISSGSNGILRLNQESTNELKFSQETLTVGTLASNEATFSGQLDDLRFYNKALEENEIRLLARLRDPNTYIERPPMLLPRLEPGEIVSFFIFDTNELCWYVPCTPSELTMEIPEETTQILAASTYHNVPLVASKQIAEIITRRSNVKMESAGDVMQKSSMAGGQDVSKATQEVDASITRENLATQGASDRSGSTVVERDRKELVYTISDTSMDSVFTSSELGTLSDEELYQWLEDHSFLAGIFDSDGNPLYVDASMESKVIQFEMIKNILDGRHIDIERVFNRKHGELRIGSDCGEGCIQLEISEEKAHFGQKIICSISIENNSNTLISDLIIACRMPKHTTFVTVENSQNQTFNTHFSESNETLFLTVNAPLEPGYTFRAFYVIELDRWKL